MSAPVRLARLRLRQAQLTVPQGHLREILSGPVKADLKALMASPRNTKKNLGLTGNNKALPCPESKPGKELFIAR
jgi:hypothetical protein